MRSGNNMNFQSVSCRQHLKFWNSFFAWWCLASKLVMITSLIGVFWIFLKFKYNHNFSSRIWKSKLKSWHKKKKKYDFNMKIICCVKCTYLFKLGLKYGEKGILWSLVKSIVFYCILWSKFQKIITMSWFDLIITSHSNLHVI